MDKLLLEGLTFDDVLVVPMRSKVLFENICLKTRLVGDIFLNAPLISSPMDTVTEARMAIAVARQGGIGIIHKNMSIEEQAQEVDKVKRSEFGVITNPFSLGPNQYVYEAIELMARYRISGIPITEYDTLVGIVTNRDLRFESDTNKKIYEVMTRKEALVTAPVGTTLEEAKAILDQKKIEKLPIVDENGDLKGLITTKDIAKSIAYPNSAKDERGSLLVGAAVDASEDTLDRIGELVKKKVDIIVLDITYAHTEEAIYTLKNIKKEYPGIKVMAGNVCTKEATIELIEAGADAVRVGIGPGSVCATGAIAGVGMPQITAIMECAKAAAKYNIPIIADGGIKHSGDIVKALVAGANAVMIGNLFAGCDQSPGDVDLYQGRKYKQYNSKIKKAISCQKLGSKLTMPEGVEARVVYKGNVIDVIQEIVSGLRTGMVYTGSDNIEHLRENGRFVKISKAGHAESLPHSIHVTKDATNYTTI